MSIQPRKVFLNFNLTNKDYSGHFKTTRLDLNQSYIQDNSMALNKMHVTQQHNESKMHLNKDTIPEYCYLLYVDNIESLDKRDYCLKFKIRQVIQQCFRKNIIYDNKIYECFVNYSTQQIHTNNQISFKGISTNEDLINLYFFYKKNNDEYKIRQMYNYFFVPSQLNGEQILSEIKSDLQETLSDYLNQKVDINVITFLNQIEVTNITDLGWNPPMLLCGSSLEILKQNIEIIKEKIQFQSKVESYYSFKTNICRKYGKSLQINNTHRSQTADKLTFPSIKQDRNRNQLNCSYECDSSSKEQQCLQVEQIKQKYPNLTYSEMIQIHIDYKSLLNTNKKCITSDDFKYRYLPHHSEKEYIRLLKALGMSIFTNRIQYEQFFRLRVFMAFKISVLEIIDFLFDYFEPINGIVVEKGVIEVLLEIGKRIQIQQKKKSSFPQTFTKTILRWMNHNNYFVEGELIKEQMAKEGDKQQYVYFYLLDCIFQGQSIPKFASQAFKI